MAFPMIIKLGYEKRQLDFTLQVPLAVVSTSP